MGDAPEKSVHGFHHLGDAVELEEGTAEGGGSRIPESHPGGEFTKQDEGQPGVVMLRQQIEIAMQHGEGSPGGSPALALAFLEDPGVAQGGPADHHRIHPVFLQALPGPVGAADVAVADDGQLGPLLDLGDEVPVGAAGIPLRSCAPVDGDPVAAGVGRSGHAFVNGFFLVAPPRPHLDGERQVDVVPDLRQVGFQVGGVAHEGGAATFLDHLLDGAAQVDIDEMRSCFPHLPRRLPQVARLLAEQLNADEGSRVGVNPHHFPGFLGVVPEALGRDQLGNQDAGAHFVHELAERDVGDPRHGGQPVRVAGADDQGAAGRRGGPRRGLRGRSLEGSIHDR